MEETDLVTSLIPAIKEQIESKETPYVRAAYQRLEKNEIEQDDILHMLALCLADESNRMFIDKRDFDIIRYQQLLDQLPELPE